jgi:hypothetical protein
MRKSRLYDNLYTHYLLVLTNNNLWFNIFINQFFLSKSKKEILLCILPIINEKDLLYPRLQIVAVGIVMNVKISSRLCV